MMDWKTFAAQMFTPGTRSCALFGAVVGCVFAVLCLTIGTGKTVLIGVFCLIGAFIGGVKDKAGFVRKTILFFHRDGVNRYE